MNLLIYRRGNGGSGVTLHTAGHYMFTCPFTDPFKIQRWFCSTSLHWEPPPSTHLFPLLMCAPPATGHGPSFGGPVPGPPPRQHLAPAAGWRGRRCPRCWRPGRCRLRSCLAPPAGSTASHSAPGVGGDEEGTLCLPFPLAGLRPCTPEAGRQREAARQAQEAKAKPLLWPVSQRGLCPHPPAPLPGLHLPLTLYRAPPTQPQGSLAPDPGPGQGPLL